MNQLLAVEQQRRRRCRQPLIWMPGRRRGARSRAPGTGAAVTAHALGRRAGQHDLVASAPIRPAGTSGLSKTRSGPPIRRDDDAGLVVVGDLDRQVLDEDAGEVGVAAGQDRARSGRCGRAGCCDTTVIALAVVAAADVEGVGAEAADDLERDVLATCSR